jgi:hypothetical protein
MKLYVVWLVSKSTKRYLIKAENKDVARAIYAEKADCKLSLYIQSRQVKNTDYLPAFFNVNDIAQS